MGQHFVAVVATSAAVSSCAVQIYATRIINRVTSGKVPAADTFSINATSTAANSTTYSTIVLVLSQQSLASIVHNTITIGPVGIAGNNFASSTFSTGAGEVECVGSITENFAAIALIAVAIQIARSTTTLAYPIHAIT
jgi:hypothetical protein